MKFRYLKGLLICSIILCFSDKVIGQETILEPSFAVRDFKILDSSLIFIEKRNIKSFNLELKKEDSIIDKDGFFIGGYGLKLVLAKDENKIITASNELVQDRSSIRFYDIEKRDVNKYKVLYSNRIVDFHASPKDSLLFLSHKDSTIKVYRYGIKPWYKNLHTIKLNSISRRINYSNGNIFYITDKGEVFRFNISNEETELIEKIDQPLVNFEIDVARQKIYATTINGELIILNIGTPQSRILKTLKIGTSIPEAMAIIKNDYLLIGDWDGNISAVNLNTFQIKVIHKLNHRIIKILPQNEIFYTSTLDKKIRKWKFKLF